jgi:hypothetical protein
MFNCAADPREALEATLDRELELKKGIVAIDCCLSDSVESDGRQLHMFSYFA